MKRLGDDQWRDINERLATGFEAQGVVLQSAGLTFESYFAEARARALDVAPMATLPARIPSNYEQNGPPPVDEESTGISDTLEIDRRRLNQGVTPFVAGHFTPPKVAISEVDELGETAFITSPVVAPPLPFKPKK